MSNNEYQALPRMQSSDQIVDQLCSGPHGRDAALADLLRGEAQTGMRGLIADLGGHDLRKLRDAFREAGGITDRPVAILAYTVKGWGLPLARDPAAAGHGQSGRRGFHEPGRLSAKGGRLLSAEPD